MSYPNEKEIEEISDFAIDLIKDWKPTVVLILGDIALEKVALNDDYFIS